LITIDVNSPLSTCSRGDGQSPWGSVTLPIPAAAFAAAQPALLEFEVVQGGSNARRVFIDNVAVTATGPDQVVTAGNPPDLTSAGGPYDLRAGESFTFTIPTTVTGAPADPGFQFSNLASATSNQQTVPVTAAVSTPYLDPAFTIEKTAYELWVNDFDPATHAVTYQFEARNTGNTPLSPVSIVDPLCDAAPVLVSGDLNADGVLQIGEVWRYECTRTIAGTAQDGCSCRSMRPTR
jgi:hypothetical protein